MDILGKEEGVRKSLIIGFFAFFIALIFSKNTFAEDKKIYISRVYATDSKEFVELFNSGEDYKFKEISLKNNQKQIEIVKVQNGIFKSQEYITFAQNAQNSDVKFKEEFRNIDTIGQKPILGLYIDVELKDYICSDEKRCIKGFVKNSTDLKPSNRGVEKIAISKAEILKNGDKMTPIEDRNNYNFGLRNLDNYSPRFGGLKLEKSEKLNDKKDELEKNPEAPKREDKAEGKKVLNPENEDSEKGKEENKANINEEKSIFKDSENLKNEKNIVFIQDKQPEQPEKNTKNQKISLKKCGIEIYTGNNKDPQKIDFKDIEILPNDFLTINFNSENSFKFSKTGNNKIILLNSKNQEIQSVELKGSKKNLSWIFNGKEWQQSFKITKNSENILQVCEDGFFLNAENHCEKNKKTCQAGYFLNEETDRCNKIKEENQERKCENGYFLNLETNRCNKILVEKATLECHEGYERNLETNRCRKISSTIVSKKDVLCAPGYTRNPETNRCRKNSNEVKKELAPCKDGYERNEETNRCRKVVKNSGASDDVKKDEEKSKQAKFTGWWIIAVVILVFLAILFFEFRKDIFAKFSKGKK